MMQDCWYADNRDLVKWGVLLHLAENFGAQRVLQLAFYRASTFGKIVIEGRLHELPVEVIDHFRDLRTIQNIRSGTKVTVFDPPFQDRSAYLQSVLTFLGHFAAERCIVFLDPDTGLEPRKKPGLEHVLDTEAKTIWDAMKNEDVFVFYQHRTNRTGQPWIETKQEQLAAALNVETATIRVASAPEIARDVVFFYLQRG